MSDNSQLAVTIYGDVPIAQLPSERDGQCLGHRYLVTGHSRDLTRLPFTNLAGQQHCVFSEQHAGRSSSHGRRCFLKERSTRRTR